MTDSIPEFIPVDNAAQIFIPNYSKKETTMSRIAVSLKAPVEKERLEHALKNIIGRFPFFQVYLKKNFFDFVFQRTDDLPPVEDDSEWANRYVDFEDDNFPFRIKIHKKIIALEMSHILSDGFGTMSFLLSLVTEYLKLDGREVGESIYIKRPGEDISGEEWECAYRKNFGGRGVPVKIPQAAYIPKSDMIPVEKYYTTRLIMDLEKVRADARFYHVTLNVYMSAIFGYALQQIYLEDIASGMANRRRPVRILIPVNLRQDYPSSCLRNFSYLYAPKFYPGAGPYTFDEIIEIVSADIRHERHSGAIEKQISRNLKAEKNPLFRIMPRAIKKVLYRSLYYLFARNHFSGVLTNLGDIRLPEELVHEIDSFDILPCNSPMLGRSTSLFSYNGNLEMNIGSSCTDMRFEEKIMEKLDKRSIKYRVIYKRDDAPDLSNTVPFTDKNKD